MTFIEAYKPVNFTRPSLEPMSLTGTGLLIPSALSTEPFDSNISKCDCTFKLTHMGNVMNLVTSKQTVMMKTAYSIWYDESLFVVRVLKVLSEYKMFLEVYSVDMKNKSTSRIPNVSVLIKTTSTLPIISDYDVVSSISGNMCTIVDRNSKKVLRYYSSGTLVDVTSIGVVKSVQQYGNNLLVTYNDNAVKSIQFDLSTDFMELRTHSSSVLFNTTFSVYSFLDSLPLVEFKQHSFLIGSREYIFDINNNITSTTIRNAKIDSELKSVWIQTDTKIHHFLLVDFDTLDDANKTTATNKNAVYENKVYKYIGSITVTTEHNMFIEKDLIFKLQKNIIIHNSTQILSLNFYSDNMTTISRTISAPQTSYNMLARQFSLTVINANKYNTVVKDVFSQASTTFDINKQKMYYCRVDAVSSKSINLKKVNTKVYIDTEFSYNCINTFKLN